jgi:hypothetical protein
MGDFRALNKFLVSLQKQQGLSPPIRGIRRYNEAVEFYFERDRRSL